MDKDEKPAAGTAGEERVSCQDGIKFTSAHPGAQGNSPASDGVERVPLDSAREGDGDSGIGGGQEGTPVTEVVVPNCGASGSRGEGGAPPKKGGLGAGTPSQEQSHKDKNDYTEDQLPTQLNSAEKVENKKELDSCPSPSVTRPSEIIPRPSPSVTSVSLFQDKGVEIEKEGVAEDNPIRHGSAKKESETDLTDVTDRGNSVTDGCLNVTDALASREQARQNETFEAHDLEVLYGPKEGGIVISGAVLLRQMHQPRSKADRLEAPTLAELLDRDVPPDTVIEAGPGLVFLDGDVSSRGSPPEPAYVDAVIEGLNPRPDAAWRTHGGGIRGVYVGEDAEVRATLAGMTVPREFGVEILKHSRHPRSIDPKRPKARCSRVRYFPPSQASIKETLLERNETEAAERRQELGLEVGQRYGHDRCPIDPHSNCASTDCIQVYEEFVICYRCRALEMYAPGESQPGIYHFAPERLRQSRCVRMAQNLVHFFHADFVLRHDFPSFGPRLRKALYRYILHVLHGDSDPRITMVWDEELRLARGDGFWFDDRFTVSKIDHGFLSGVPACHALQTNEKGAVGLKFNPVIASNFIYRVPRGYPPIVLTRGLSLRDYGELVPVQVDTDSKFPVRLLPPKETLGIDEALAILSESFPGLSTTYLLACIAAGPCADAGAGQPPMLLAAGTSGSGKGETIRLAASFMGHDTIKITLFSEPERTLRAVGQALAEGHRYLVVDEVGKYTNLFGYARPLLEIGSEVFWRPLYENGVVRTPCRAAFFYPTVTVPGTMASNAEFSRRIRFIRLFDQVPNWAATSGGDTAAWRGRSAENAFVANSILTHVWEKCHEFKYRFF